MSRTYRLRTLPRLPGTARQFTDCVSHGHREDAALERVVIRDLYGVKIGMQREAVWRFRSALPESERREINFEVARRKRDRYLPILCMGMHPWTGKRRQYFIAPQDVRRERRAGHRALRRFVRQYLRKGQEPLAERAVWGAKGLRIIAIARGEY